MVAEFTSTSSECAITTAAKLIIAVSFPFDILTGESSADERMDMVDRFQDPKQDLYILLISTMAGGVGLNLTAVGATCLRDQS